MTLQPPRRWRRGDRVLHLVTDPSQRGAQTVAVALDGELRRLGAPGTIVALRPVAEGQAAFASVRPLSHRGAPQLLSAAIAVRHLHHLLAQDAPRLVLAHGSEAAGAAVVAATGTGVPIIWHRILTLPDTVLRSRLRSLPWRVTAQRVAGVVAHSSATAAELSRLGYRGPMCRIPTHRPALPFTSLARESDRERLLAEMSLDASTLLIGLVGHLVSQKRPERAVDVLARVRRSGVDAHLVVIGEGPCKAEVTRHVSDHGMAGHVTLLGHRDDVPRLLSGLDLVVITSDADSISGVVVEALMAGCPIVAFELDDFSLAVVPGTTGTLVPVGRVDQLAAAVVDLASDRGALENMRAPSRRLSASFLTEHAARKYLDFFASCVEGGTSSSA